MSTAKPPKFRKITLNSFKPGAVWVVKDKDHGDLWTLTKNNDKTAKEMCGKYKRYGWPSYGDVFEIANDQTVMFLDYCSISAPTKLDPEAGHTVIKFLYDGKIAWWFLSWDLEDSIGALTVEYKELVLPPSKSV